MRFSFDIPDELVRGVTTGPGTPQATATSVSANGAPALSGGAALATGGEVPKLQAAAGEAMSAGAAEEILDLARGGDPFAMVMDGGAGPRT